MYVCTCLFQRLAVENRLINEYEATSFEITHIATMLDKGFAYANGVSAYAAPLSLVTNRLTGKELICCILQSADRELYGTIKNLSWNTLYKLSINDTWLDFVDHLNELLLLYQQSERRKEKLFGLVQIECSLITQRLIQKLYESAMDLLQPEWLKIGTYIMDIGNLDTHSDKLLELCLYNKNEYFEIIKQIDELMSALKIVISGLDRRYRNSTMILKDNGYSISLDRDIL